MHIGYHPDASAEAMDAATWYEARQKGLGRQFLEKWQQAERRVAADPWRTRPFQGDFRLGRLDVFPFALVYRISDHDQLDVIAVMHLHREPGYWQSRTRGS